MGCEVMVEKIVSKALKIDLHIHSALSSHKDGKKVGLNNLMNLDKLICGLNKHQVNMLAITDHDAFDFCLYKKLKEQEGIGSIKKVLPGVEFSVEFEHNDLKKELHVINIFDDSDLKRIKNIEQILSFKNGRPAYDRVGAFSQEKFIEILRNIDLNTIMIVHQKNSLLSKNISSNSHDANALGDEKLEEFIYTEYFEAYEFRNRKNELFSKVYIVEKKFQDLLRLITGSDCHSWELYPNLEDESDYEFDFTYLKCLPTFKGLVMAMTDYTRIKRNESFFSIDEKKLQSIEISIDGVDFNIPMSRGINVIIGDNSIGKSLLLHKLTSYTKTTQNLQKGYNNYLSQNKIEIKSIIDEGMLFLFDAQGEIRNNFEKGTLNTTKLLTDYYPKTPSVKQYTDTIDREILKYINCLESKVSYTVELNNLTDFKILTKENSETITLLVDIEINKSKIDENISARDDLKKLIQDIEDFIEKHTGVILAKEIVEMNEFIKKIKSYLARIEKKIAEITYENNKMNKIISVFTDTSIELKKIKGDTDKEIESFYESLKETKNTIIKIKKKEYLMTDYEPNIETVEINPFVNTIYKYNFINKLPISKIDNSYITQLIKSIHKNGWDLLSNKLLADDQIIESISRYPSTDSSWQEVIKKKSVELYEKDFVYKPTILSEDEKDLTREMSSGKNMQMYFDLISYNSFQKGIYLVDQPEDSVAQKSIKDYLLERFKNMSENRQIIIVTHNPQFIVNLDVDNVIFISKSEDNNQITIKSGALEYESIEKNNEYKILEIVANNIDGGIETIRRRWKRYDKTNKIGL